LESGTDPTRESVPPAEGGSAWARLIRSVRGVWPVALLAVGALALAVGIGVGVATKPRPDLPGPLRAAERAIEDGEFQAALDVLNTEVLPVVGQSWVPVEQRARYHLLVARAVALGERALGIEDPENAATVRREYHAAERAGAELSADDHVRLSEAHIRLGQEDRALLRVRELPDGASDARRAILRRLVEHELNKPRPEYDRAVEVLGAISGDPELSAADRAWSMARETEIRLGQGYAAEAVARLLQGILRLERAPKGALAELYVLLGQGYYDLGEYASAKTQLERALSMLGATEPMTARAHVMLARCEQAMGELEAARDRYAGVVEWSEKMEWHLPALFGLAQTEGMTGRTEESIRAFAGVVEALVRGERHPLVTPERVASALLDRARDRMEADDPRSALRFVLRAEELFSLGGVSPEVLLTLARAHELLADRLISEGAEGSPRPATSDPLEVIAALDPATRERAQRHALAAGKYYRQHAAAVMLSDNEAYVRSLWASAWALERGGDHRAAAAAYREYVEGVPDDPGSPGRPGTRAEARFRLARCAQAMGEHGVAAEIFGALISDAELGLEGVGQYGAESYVPLAQVYLADSDESNDEEALRLLEEAVSGRLGDEGSKHFRAGLIELGALHHRRGEYARAIERLTEAAERYPDDPDLPLIRFRLADSLRQEAAAIERTLSTEAMPDAREVELEALRREHLSRAIALFDGVRETLDAVPEARRKASERIALRNSHFYLGDCAFDLGDYEAAVRHYELARERYSEDPASLVAMVQVVNAYIAMGQKDKARAANERAKRFFGRLPEDAWNDPYLPMGRADWERWLDSTAELYGFSDQP
jgi:tetratricopeptide (TPR) repeat protein